MNLDWDDRVTQFHILQAKCPIIRKISEIYIETTKNNTLFNNMAKQSFKQTLIHVWKEAILGIARVLHINEVNSKTLINFYFIFI